MWVVRVDTQDSSVLEAKMRVTINFPIFFPPSRPVSLPPHPPWRGTSLEEGWEDLLVLHPTTLMPINCSHLGFSSSSSSSSSLTSNSFIVLEPHPSLASFLLAFPLLYLPSNPLFLTLHPALPHPPPTRALPLSKKSLLPHYSLRDWLLDELTSTTTSQMLTQMKHDVELRKKLVVLLQFWSFGYVFGPRLWKRRRRRMENFWQEVITRPYTHTHSCPCRIPGFPFTLSSLFLLLLLLLLWKPRLLPSALSLSLSLCPADCLSPLSKRPIFSPMTQASHTYTHTLEIHLY